MRAAVLCGEIVSYSYAYEGRYVFNNVYKEYSAVLVMILFVA